MNSDYPVDSKLKLNQYRLERKPANTAREELEKRMEMANYKKMIKKEEMKNI